MDVEEQNVSGIIEEFASYGFALNDEVANYCVALCKQYDINAEQLAVLWVSFAPSHGYDSVTTESLEHLDRIEQSSLKKKVAASSRNNCLNVNVNNGRLHNSDEEDEDLLEGYGILDSTSEMDGHTRTPKSSKTKRTIGQVHSISSKFHSPNFSNTVTSPSVKYISRTNSGEVVAKYGCTSGDMTWSASPTFKPQIKVLCTSEDEQPLTKPYLYMYEKADSVADAISNMILALAEDMKDLMLNKGKEEEEEEYAAVNEICSEVFPTVGRIRHDCDGRLNSSSIMVDGFGEPGRSHHVSLDLSHINTFSIFPGQIVGIRGTNSTGSKLIATELVEGKLPANPVFPITLSSNTGPVQLVVACGPFTTTSNLLFEPLTDLLNTVRDNPPQVLILLGPFLDSSHPLVVNNDLGETHTAIFDRCLNIISSTLESTGTKIILVPSSRDLSSHMVYPTPPYDVSGAFMCVSDPALLSIEGVVIALTSTDILHHLAREEISCPPQALDRFGRTIRHILMQRSMYPLYPPHESMQINMEQLEIYSYLPVKPHLMVIPSDLKSFAKEVEGCVAVNPERLAKGYAGGTYARIELNPPSSSEAVSSFINVNVLKV